MASVEVFVDDAVLGRLPNICAVTGVPATGRFRIEQARGGIGLGWLLILLGPIGWIVLLVVALAAPREVLSVRLPYATSAVSRELRLSRLRFVIFLVSIVLAIAGWADAAPFPRSVWLVAALIAFVAAIAVSIWLSWIQVDVRLDASRRWVTLVGVHPSFASAVRARDAADDSKTATSAPPQ